MAIVALDNSSLQVDYRCQGG